MMLAHEKDRYYWLLSNAEDAKFCRARNDVPLEEVVDATAEEAAEICGEIRKRLAKGDFCELWVKVLVYFHDTEAVEMLEACLRRYKARHWEAKRIGGGFTSWIRLLKDAIKQLNRAAKRDTRAYSKK